MKSLRSLLGAIARCNAGATSVEYGLIALLIAVTITAGVAPTGNGIRGVFADISKAMDGPANEPARQFP
jgi:Flp pilus assembly pilin Flp